MPNRVEGLRVHIDVWDKDTASDEYMGGATWILKPLDGQETKGNYDLHPRDPSKPIKAGKTLGYITVNIKYRSVSYHTYHYRVLIWLIFMNA